MINNQLEKRISIFIKTLVIITVCFIVGYVILQIMNNLIGGYFIENINHFFDLNDEHNLQTFYSVLLLAFSSLLLYIISNLYRISGKKKNQWLVLSFIFLFVSADESTGIHEKLGSLFKTLIGSSNLPDYLQYGWVLPYLVILLFLITYFSKFFLGLDRETRIRFVSAFIIFISGAAGFEMIESRYHQMYGTYDITYKVFVTIEETMEMVGTIIFIRALLMHIAENFPDIDFFVKVEK